MVRDSEPKRLSPWREKMHEVIFEADTPAGKRFDVALLLAIVVGVGLVVLESVAAVEQHYGPWLRAAEWFITILFTIEYLLRLISVRRPLRYAFSFLGLVDFLALVPTYLSVFIAGTQPLLVIRALRLLRVFRVFKFARYLSEMAALIEAIRATKTKIAVFLITVLTLVLIMGTLMYVIEGEQSGFTSIPRGVYWAIVTVTTVGYGDIAPVTVLGQLVAAVAMVIGYSLIIIPTGIFSVELLRAKQGEISTQSCPSCSREGHDSDAIHCKYCGDAL
jgi:voltage-gated potassium channel